MLRRHVLLLIACGICVPELGRTQAPGFASDLTVDALGCALNDRQASALSNRAEGFSAARATLIDTSGDAELDAALGRALVRLARAFGQNPGFGFFDDSKGKNAYASPRSQIPGTWGTVFYGKRMFQEIMDQANDGGMAALTIAAHEFGHIAQFRSKADIKLLEGQNNVRRVELHADYLAGWYLGTRKRAQPNLRLWAAGRTIYEIGDESFNDPQHHGTPEQRVAASEQGYALGLAGENFQHAFDQGLSYVLERY
jgi:hypothetical protein